MNRTRQSLKFNGHQIPEGHAGIKVQTIEYTLHIYVKHIVPSFLFREVEEGSTPSDARVIHEYVELVLLFAELCDEGVAARF